MSTEALLWINNISRRKKKSGNVVTLEEKKPLFLQMDTQSSYFIRKDDSRLLEQINICAYILNWKLDYLPEYFAYTIR